MSDDPPLKMYGTQAELDKLKEEMKEIRENVDAYSIRVSNPNGKFSEANETLNKQNKTSSQHNEISTNQDEVIEVFNLRENSLEKQTILLLGRWDEVTIDNLLILQNNQQDWKELNVKLPCRILGYGAQFLNNNLYIFGGRDGEEILNSMYKLSGSLEWEKMADMYKKRHRIVNSSVILNNQIWVCGGYDGNKSLKTVEMYDPETNKWKRMKSMKQYRQHAAAAVVNGKIFCSGDDNSVECYDPSSDVWTKICNMPQKIWGHGAVEIDGHFTLIGGWNLTDKYLKNVWAWDTTDKNAKWIEKPSMFIPREYFSIAKIDGKIFVCGGETEEDGILKNLDDVEVFDEGIWRNGPMMPTPRTYAAAVVIPIEFAQSLE